MNRNFALFTALAPGVVMLVVGYFTLGGFTGIVRDPMVAAGVLGVMTVITVPFSWFQYRRLMRNPTFNSVLPPEAGSVASGADDAPVEILGSSKAALLRLVWILPFVGVVLWAGWRQPGVCRVASLGLMAPAALWAMIAILLVAITPDRLELARSGITYVSLGRTRHWNWNEVGPITLVKSDRPMPIPFVGFFLRRNRATGFYFRRRLAPASVVSQAAAGPSRQGFRPFWSNIEAVAQQVSAAQARWSSPAATSRPLAPWSWRDFARLAVTLVLVGGFVWMSVARPCGG